MGLSEFNNPLKSLPQELIPTPLFKPMNMFSTNSGALFGSPLSSSGLHLSSNNATSSSGYISGSAHMSATALLQKAAQMGASATNSMNSPMIQRTFVTTMAGPDPLPRPTTFDNTFLHHNQNEQPPPPFNNGGFPSHLFEVGGGGGGGGSAVSDMMMYGGMLMSGDDQNSAAAAGFLKNVAEAQEGTSARYDMTTVDFLGVGGSRQQQNMHDHRLEMDQQQQRMQLMHNINNPFHQQHDSSDHGERPLYNSF